MDFPFTTDGCSGLFMRAVHLWWKLRGKHELSKKVTALCRQHDGEYHPGGSALDRFRADLKLVSAVADLGQVALARAMIMGLGPGGVWWLPLPWRWGYGWKWPRGYTKEPTR
jgi:hypothetical protein